MFSSANESTISVAIIDRDKNRCEQMAKRFSGLKNVRSVFAWYWDPEPAWTPSPPQDSVIAICHFGDHELEQVKEINSAAIVYYGGGGGVNIAQDYVIWREITGAGNALTADEAAELVEFLQLPQQERTPERLPVVLRPHYPYLLQSLAVLCQAYLALNCRLNQTDDTAKRLAEFSADRSYCQSQFDRLRSTALWLSIFGSPFPIQRFRAEWNESRGNIARLNQFTKSLNEQTHLETSTVEATYKDLKKQLRLWSSHDRERDT